MRLFVSSPSDVMAERARVDVVAERLNGEYAGLTEIEVIRWETGFYTANRSFQEAIDTAIGGMRSTDMVVCILWKRVGTELSPGMWKKPDGTPYESGTVFEFETALAAGREQPGTPDVYLFRKTAPITYAAENYATDHAQHQILESVWKRWTETADGHNVAGNQHFTDADDFERQLELCLRQWLERRGIVVHTVWDRRTNGSPFRGLEAFNSEHAPVFFGRESAIARAVARLRQAEAAGMPFLLLVGASGSGKSSLLRAGLVPRITRAGTIAGIDQWRTALVVPEGDPLASLAAALFAPGALGDDLRDGPFSTPDLLTAALAAGGEVALVPLHDALQRAARRRADELRYEAPRPARILIAIDQVERLFAEAEPARVNALAEILRALAERRLAAVIVALRSDAYARFQLVPGFVALMEAAGTAFNLLPPGESELEDIVRGPVAACHPPLAFEEAQGGSLAEKLVADAEGGDALALLQMTLQRLYDAEGKRGDGVLRAADYPGMDAAVTDTAEEALAGVGVAARAELPALLTALVGDVVDQQPIGIALDRQVFERGIAARTALIDAFIERRLLTAEGPRVRPVHDALLRTWPEATRIITENASLIRVRHTIEPIAAIWEGAAADAKADHLMISSALLAGAEGLLGRFGDDLPPAMRAFTTAALAADRARRDAERRRHRRIFAATAAGLVIALVLAGLAGWQWRVAGAERRVAEAQTVEAKHQRDLAEAQRVRAQHGIDLATETANGMIFDIVQRFRNTGMPAATIAAILEQTLHLLDQLAAGGDAPPALRRSQAAALDETSDTMLAIGDSKRALETAKKAAAIDRELIALDPGNPDRQSSLGIASEKIGNALVAQGDLTGALGVFRDEMELSQRVAKQRPEKVVFQRNLAVAHEKIGDILRYQGKLEDALAEYRAELDIAKPFADAHPDDGGWQRFLSVIYEKIGDILRAQSDFDGALAQYRADLAIMSKIARENLADAANQRDLSVAHNKVGDILRQQKNLTDALTEFRAGMEIMRRLVTQDPGNAGWRRDLSISHERIGGALYDQGDLASAMAEYRAELDITQYLANRDPGNAEWQRGVYVSQTEIGFIAARQDDLAAALDAYQKAEKIAVHLKRINPTAAATTTDLDWVEARLREIRDLIAAAKKGK